MVGGGGRGRNGDGAASADRGGEAADALADSTAARHSIRQLTGQGWVGTSRIWSTGDHSMFPNTCSGKPLAHSSSWHVVQQRHGWDAAQRPLSLRPPAQVRRLQDAAPAGGGRTHLQTMSVIMMVLG